MRLRFVVCILYNPGFFPGLGQTLPELTDFFQNWEIGKPIGFLPPAGNFKLFNLDRLA